MVEVLWFRIILAICVVSTQASGSYVCNHMTAEDLANGGEDDLSTCYFGVENSPCWGQRCLKGPGEMCGGRWEIYGKCELGLYCSNCNRCTGCSYSAMRCFYDSECLF